MLLDLTSGVAQFRSEVHPLMAELFGPLADGQEPDVLFIACSDSRVVPSLITQTNPGDLFVCRNAGNVVPPFGALAEGLGVAASVEYAVQVLGVGQIIVCGHSDCGAVKGALQPDSVEALPAVKQWLQFVGTGSDASDLDHAVGVNVLQQLEHLRSYGFIADAVSAGKLRLRGWVYDIGSGEVREWSGTDFDSI